MEIIDVERRKWRIRHKKEECGIEFRKHKSRENK
jgi:hypothetical protein